MTPLLSVEDAKVYFSANTGFIAQMFGPQREVKAVDGVSLAVGGGEIVGLAGASGSGKSSLAFAILRHHPLRAGRIAVEGRDIWSLDKEGLRDFRRSVQLVFQDPYQSLNPRFTVFRCVAEPLAIHGERDAGKRRARAVEALEHAGLRPAEDYLERYPHELSGGQRQRVAIARAIVLRPKLLIADEPVSMLDVSVRAGILRLLKSFAKDEGVGILYVSHDLGTIRYICDRVAVMHRGKIVEVGATEDVIRHPQHPYTRALIDAVPEVDPRYARPAA
ncbi:MAG TPA: ATP-binding cassette domain-containing protein [Xanthobacteraceae bacterium]|nr:ATP-binding cassette domain-containing protein [Xanthobacteraceae bacterium]